MDGLQNIARQQVTQMSNPAAQGRESEHARQVAATHQIRQENMDSAKKTASEDEVNDLVKRMNDALNPFNTSIKFGVDKQDTFYVSVIDTKSEKMLRRFPIEQAVSFLPKIKELTGIIFDTKG